jgi:hypothetical protein
MLMGWMALMGACSGPGFPSFAVGGPDYGEDARTPRDASAGEAADAGETGADSGMLTDAAQDRADASDAFDASGDAQRAAETDAGMLSAEDCQACEPQPSLPDGWCSDRPEKPVEWTCGGHSARLVELLNDSCEALPTGSVRFCCPQAFAPCVGQ